MAHIVDTRSRAQAIQRSLEALCEFLNLGEDEETGEIGQVRLVLQGPNVEPFFIEYARDYLMEAEEIEDIELPDLVAWCQENNAFHSERYWSPSLLEEEEEEEDSSTSWEPDKSDWEALDHAARFAVQVLQYSWNTDGPWSNGTWDPTDDESELELWQVWLILRHLQAEWEAMYLPDWNEESLEKLIAEMYRMKL